MPDYYAPTPAATEFANWLNTRRQISDTYGINNANIEYQRGNLKAQQQGNAEYTGKQQGLERQGQYGAFNRRGVLSSGIFKRAQSQLADAQNFANWQSASQYQNQLGQLNLDQYSGNTQYTSGIAGVDSLEAARRADLAAQIKDLVG